MSNDRPPTVPSHTIPVWKRFVATTIFFNVILGLSLIFFWGRTGFVLWEFLNLVMFFIGSVAALVTQYMKHGRLS